jgi:hypothetical protein
MRRRRHSGTTRKNRGTRGGRGASSDLKKEAPAPRRPSPSRPGHWPPTPETVALVFSIAEKVLAMAVLIITVSA